MSYALEQQLTAVKRQAERERDGVVRMRARCEEEREELATLTGAWREEMVPKRDKLLLAVKERVGEAKAEVERLRQMRMAQVRRKTKLYEELHVALQAKYKAQEHAEQLERERNKRRRAMQPTAPEAQQEPATKRIKREGNEVKIEQLYRQQEALTRQPRSAECNSLTNQMATHFKTERQR